MNKAIAFFKIIRPANLMMIALTMYAMRHFIIEGFFSTLGNHVLTLQLGHFQFFLLVLSVILIAAGGYIINDANDIKTDRINKPEKLNYVTQFSTETLGNFHLALNIVGIALGAYLANLSGIIALLSIHVFASASLWFYSTHFKRNFLSGNLIIALITALVPIMVGLFEIPLIIKQYGNLVLDYFSSQGIEYEYLGEVYFRVPMYWCIAFGLFAFMTTLSREIIKDIEDTEGDKALNHDTLAIRWGASSASKLAVVINLLIVVFLFYIHINFLADGFTFIYFSCLSLFISIVSWKLYQSKEKKQFALISLLMKVIMLMGIAYSYYAYLMFNKLI
jgi:4-hydroxybenzoate polyprenyltransferase